MARLSFVIIHVLLSLAASAAAVPDDERQLSGTDCSAIRAPAALTWLLQDQPFEREDPSAFFYVNQDIDASGNKANRVAQLITFRGVQDREPADCRLLFAMPDDAESWELIQHEGSPTMRVFRIPGDDDDAVQQKTNPLGVFQVRPGTQAIHLGRCDGGGSFVFELANPGRSRVAFRQTSKPDDGFGVFMATGCPIPRRAMSEDL
ncbi:hypothetical protein CGRA01v4_05185 [Colletotrichum graminicola]|uniref:Ubiquitin 3 binding protein But2 C-terminal domain-containing protein n=1 Tax=Colletotrichum graminicola (strain M1.001 / M2 / FGSC 10212) TaxID=645133 RepID=E3QEV8_COLGM|nr:uncharacterized protein GLRG_04558 [Colletotrichum graminicola M1.001]EFQ29414.1 hypothetical protein GLRG_04558 [Colletotrichum graminicola M1.001]WDK13905.1 hypothetical protein CGRA01v4_05185 [Colletotrichum graminicola]